MRQMLVVGPFPWKAIGVSPGDWKNVQVDESFGEADAGRRLRAKAYDVIVTSPISPASRDLAMVIEARDQQPGIRTVVIAPELTAADIITALRHQVFACFAMPVVRRRAARVDCAGARRRQLEERHRGDFRAARLDHAARRVPPHDRGSDDAIHHGAGGRRAEPGSHELATAFREVLLNAMEHGAGIRSGQGDRGGRGTHGADDRLLLQGSRARFNPRAPGPRRNRGRSALAPDPSRSRGQAAGRVRHAADRETRGRGALQRARQRGVPGQAPRQAQGEEAQRAADRRQEARATIPASQQKKAGNHA